MATIQEARSILLAAVSLEQYEGWSSVEVQGVFDLGRVVGFEVVELEGEDRMYTLARVERAEPALAALATLIEATRLATSEPRQWERAPLRAVEQKIEAQQWEASKQYQWEQSAAEHSRLAGK